LEEKKEVLKDEKNEDIKQDIFHVEIRKNLRSDVKFYREISKKIEKIITTNVKKSKFFNILNKE
jgi:hypothetical protein